ncbi:MAG TPA: NAD(P)H-dependent oxidoreductase [Baekduia sp.]|nr:NAD(P)H-dependent oxidoreductase [Baekduia sp.]
MPSLSILIGSTRPERVGLPVGEWFAERARRHGAFDVELVDLAEVGLPFLDEPHHPRLRRYTRQHTKDWSARIDAADAFVFVTCEYNHGYPPALKNAIDFLHEEWQHKPVGFVSYGGVAAGTRAVQQLKPVLGALKMVSLPEAVAIPFAAQHLDEDRRFQADELIEQAAVTMVDELLRTEEALRPLRDVAV